MDVLVERLASSHQQIAEWTSFLSHHQQWQRLWQPTEGLNAFNIGLLLTAHVMALEPLELEASPDFQSRINKLWVLKDALSTNSPVCEAIEALWSDLPTIAAGITSDTLEHLASELQGIHPNIVNPGYIKFLQMKLDLPASSPDFTVDPQEVCEASRQFVELVNEVKHLDLDAGHWHELWEEGESIGLAVILHYIKHEKRSRLEQLGRIRNVNACINSNIKKIRDGLAGTSGIVDELIQLWKQRPDISGHLDGNTLQLLVSELRSNIPAVRRCFAHLCKKLPGTWAGGCGNAENPSAYLYTCVSNFINSKAGIRGERSRQGKLRGAGLSKARSPASTRTKSPKSSNSGASSPLEAVDSGHVSDDTRQDLRCKAPLYLRTRSPPSQAQIDEVGGSGLLTSTQIFDLRIEQLLSLHSSHDSEESSLDSVLSGECVESVGHGQVQQVLDSSWPPAPLHFLLESWLQDVAVKPCGGQPVVDGGDAQADWWAGGLVACA